eukprot:7775014-Pyramimonas_sp.AAC.1
MYTFLQPWGLECYPEPTPGGANPPNLTMACRVLAGAHKCIQEGGDVRAMMRSAMWLFRSSLNTKTALSKVLGETDDVDMLCVQRTELEALWTYLRDRVERWASQHMARRFAGCVDRC